MGIFRHTASKDATITDAFKLDGVTRATGSNTGRADSLEIFYLEDDGVEERSRALMEFDLGKVINDKKSNSSEYYLKLFNIPHIETTPEDFKLVVKPVSKEWTEGFGVDLDNYTDDGYQSGSNTDLGVTWEYAMSGSKWTSGGGDFHPSPVFEQRFREGEEDMEIEITPLVRDWISGSKNNYGIGIFLTSSQETGSRSYHTKKFSARGTEFFFNRPILEERWDSSIDDDRSKFTPSSSAAPPDDNLNIIHFYNYQRGQLKPVSGDSNKDVFVKIYSDSDYQNEITGVASNYPLTASIDFDKEGRYDVSFAYETTASHIYDQWFSGSEIYHEDKINIENSEGPNIKRKPEDYIININNLKPQYSKAEKALFKVVTRKKEMNPTIYTTNYVRNNVDIIDNLYYKVERGPDGKTVIPYGTGSTSYSKLSYDVSGSYFELDMNNLEKDLSYNIKLAREIDNSYNEFDKQFRFRVKR